VDCLVIDDDDVGDEGTDILAGGQGLAGIGLQQPVIGRLDRGSVDDLAVGELAGDKLELPGRGINVLPARGEQRPGVPTAPENGLPLPPVYSRTPTFSVSAAAGEAASRAGMAMPASRALPSAMRLIEPIMKPNLLKTKVGRAFLRQIATAMAKKGAALRRPQCGEGRRYRLTLIFS
jgi:hypothetical protein